MRSDPTLILPGHLEGEHVAGYEHDVQIASVFNAMLKTLDPYLRCFWVSPNSETFEHPGRWHVARFHHGGNDELNAYWVIQTPDGKYCEPQQMHFDRLLQMDTFRDAKRAYEKLQKARTDRQERRRKQFEETREYFRELLTERLAHIQDARIAITPGMKARSEGKQLLGPDGAPVTLDADKPATERDLNLSLPKAAMPGAKIAALAAGYAAQAENEATADVMRGGQVVGTIQTSQGDLDVKLKAGA